MAQEDRKYPRRKAGGKWVKRVLRHGKYRTHDENGKIVTYSKPGTVVEVPESLANASPDQFGLVGSGGVPEGAVVVQNETVASAGPTPGQRTEDNITVVDPKDNQPGKAPTPSQPLGETEPAAPIEKEPDKGTPAKASTTTVPGAKK